MDLIASITGFILGLISTSGYLGIFIMMVFESAVLPVPSEIVMPFSGFLASTGVFDLWQVVLYGTLGNLVGAWIAYFLGLRVGRIAIIKYGKYVLLNEHHLEIADGWFNKYGDKTIFFSRLTPVIRTVISLPAGISKMEIKKFTIYTLVGSIPWNFALTYLGFILGNNWIAIEGFGKYLDLLVLLGALAVLIAFLFIRYKKRSSTKKLL
jgi:membrane protein DedA with SNARE-associated domain